MNQIGGPKDLYKESGVDVAKGDELVEWLQKDDKPNKFPRGELVSSKGFAGLFRPDFRGMQDPLLVSGTDGVGTKVLLGIQHDMLRGLGIDLVAMCANDLYTLGGRPLFFLDYYATGALDDRQFKEVLTGIKDGCRESEMPLVGGETAEMPGMYERGHFDLAGFVVGVVDGDKRLGPDRVREGDKLYALPSDGFHSNGFSLIRKWLGSSPNAPRALIEKIMTPTKIYSEIPALFERVGPNCLHALAHITGGGISGNLPRVIPEDMHCVIDSAKIPTPSWMREFIESNGVKVLEVENVFNIGIGMIAAVAESSANEFERAAAELKLQPVPIGSVKKGPAANQSDADDRVRFTK